jgi:hypothetical protein
MSNYSAPVTVDLQEAGEITVAYEDMNGTGSVEIRWFQGDDEVPHMAAPHYDTVLRLIEVLLWATMAARKVEQEQWT